jgi:NCS1 nucleoside transporter family
MNSKDSQFPIETLGIERVLPHQRTDRRLINNFTLWLSANLNLSTVALGSLAVPVFHLGFVDGFCVILVFNLLAALPVAFLATLGPKLGLRQMTISRFSFGWNGAKAMALLNVATCIGWSAVNVIVGGQLAKELSGGAVSPNLAILILSVLTTLVSLYGYQYVHLYERYAWVPMAALFSAVFVFSFTSMNLTSSHLTGAAWIAALASFGATVFGYSVSWSSYAADYNVNQPESTSPRKIFTLTFFGVVLPCVFLETLGLALTTVVSFKDKTGGILLAAATEKFGPISRWVMCLFILSLIATNVPNDYSLGLSLQLLGQKWQRISRAVWTVLGTLAYVSIALVAGNGFNETLTGFLLMITYWLAPWITILLIEHFYFRKGHYEIENWNDREKLPVGWAAMIAFAIGLIGAYLGASQTLFTGPIAGKLFGADIGFELGLLFSSLSYLVLRRR